VRVDLATSTKDALTQLDTTEFGLVISDLGRREDGTENDMAGRDLTTQIRQKGITTPVFIYAGRRALAHRQELEAAGATLVTDNPARLLERAMGAITSLGR